MGGPERIGRQTPKRSKNRRFSVFARMCTAVQKNCLQCSRLSDTIPAFSIRFRGKSLDSWWRRNHPDDVPGPLESVWEAVVMVTLTAGVNGRMSKDKKSKGADSKGKKAGVEKDRLAFLQDNTELRNTLAQIEKAFGEGSIMPLGGDHQTVIEGISSGSLSVDLALGGKGFPRGRIIEIYGPESSGKTTIALHSVAAAQKAGGIAAFIDAEHALDPSWARKLGISLESLLVSQPTSGEEALQIVEMLVKSNAVDIIVVDSVAALVPQKELDGDIGDSVVGMQARLMSQAMRKLTGAIAKSKTTVIFINQLREKIGVMFGSPETTPGGKALKFYASCRVDVRRIGTLKDGEDVVGQRVKVKVVKNKVAPPFRVAEFDMMHANGISIEGDVLDLAMAAKLVDKSGTWLRYGETHLGQGREKARQFLKDNPDVLKELRDKILAAKDAVISVDQTIAGDPEAAEEAPGDE
jgi:recombination protein RecA